MRVLVAVAALVIAACSSTPTEIMVVVTSDVNALRAAQIDVSLDGTPIAQSQCTCLTGVGCPTWPLTLGLTPNNDTNNVYVVTAHGFSDTMCASVVVEQRKAVRFTVDQETTLPLSLSNDCVGVTCSGADQTCTAGTCASDTIH